MLFPKEWTAGAPFQLSPAGNLIAYIIIWAVCIFGLFFIWRRGRAAGFARWTTQDILILSIMGVLLEVYDNLIGDQFITPIIQLIPFGHAFALNDLPYMFLLMTGIALIRKPGAATAMVFLNFILMQLLYSGSGINVLMWPYGILQGLFVDLYFVLRGNRVFAKANWTAVIDGLIMGALRAVPAVTIQSAILGPYIEGSTRTLAYILLYSLFNLLGNGVEAGISAPLAIRIARSVNPGASASAETVPQAWKEETA
ncbi:MAG TPA: ECF transporter S component [Ktedonobacteraceae bacterium]|jgi:ABC-type thiamin/hydroxymethylpyrimidine transport system permease subunit|nr:ECF transporter S component [Ktedonobacteraceae bacterium]